MADKFHFVDLKGLRFSINREPDSCPLCHHAVKPEEQCWSLTGPPHQGDYPVLEIVYRCPSDACGCLFIARYQPREVLPHGTAGRRGEFRLSATAPYEPERPEFPDAVTAVSPSFADIYGEAAAAEAFKLTEIAGGGYRKALEFLIKDYCIAVSPENEENIKRSFLGTCIEDYVGDPDVKRCAKLAAWLGNDEIHYLRKWKGKDLADLKTLIRLTVNWLHNRLLTDQYISDMDEG